ncbi:MAG: DUF885 domain-containing protein [Chloroflexi bacterium]|nr:DUF885 domain-containing protein [Chloroflexota bacterium]
MTTGLASPPDAGDAGDAGDGDRTEGPRGPLDDQFEVLIKRRFDELVKRYPVFATFLGVHSEDGRLSDSSREATEHSIVDDRHFLADLDLLDPEGLSPRMRFDRELAIHGTRRGLFDLEEHRLWERRASAMDEIGDGLFLLFARDFAPLQERLSSMTSRLEAAPELMRQHRERVGHRRVRLWDEIEIRTAASMPGFFDEITAAAADAWGIDSPEQARLLQASEEAKAAVAVYTAWLRDTLDQGDDDFALGRERYDRLVELREFDGLTSDEILTIGEQQLAAHKAARAEVARSIDADATEAEVLARVKADHPADFDAALEAYRESMARARQHVIDRDLATLPEGENLAVVPTPPYLRNVLPFAAYFAPARFDPDSGGMYLVTPSVDGEPRAMLEHNRASISNTSIHEAYPGHHVQLATAMRHPSLARLLVDAPEFVEGWGMYSEQMMREQGFDDSPEHLLILHTDAIWRAARIILDVRMHRGDIDVPEAIDLLVEHTGFERANATAEVHRYTSTPTYQVSYLLGKVMLLRLREDEQRRLGDRFSLKAFHDAMLYAGSLPISYQRRVLAGEGSNGR